MKRGFRQLILFVFIFSSAIIIQSCKDSTNSGLEDSLEFIRSVEPIQGAQNVTIDLKDGHSEGATFTINLSSIESNPFIVNGQKQAWCIEWDKQVIKGEQKGVKLHSTKGQELWKDVNYFLSQKDILQQEFPSLTWKESQIIIWSLVKHKEFDIDEIPNYQGFSQNFYKDGEYLFDVEVSKEVIAKVKASSQKTVEESFGILLENEGQTVIIDGEEIPVGSAEIGPKGGKILSNDSNLLITIPEGALNKEYNFSITIDEAADELIQLNTDDYVIISDWYKLSPSGIIFNKPVQLQFMINQSRIDDTDNIKEVEILYFTDDYNEQGEIKKRYIDSNELTVTTYVEHFTSFSLIEPLKKLVYNFSWDVDTIYYYVREDKQGYLWGNERFGSADERNTLVENAVEAWQQYQGKFNIERTYNENEANIILNTKNSVFAARARTNILFFRKYGLPTTFNENTKITIDFESSEKQLSDYYSYDPYLGLSITITHEIGHALGLSHNSESSSSEIPLGIPMMWVSLFDDPFLEFERVLTGEDISSLQLLYGEPEYEIVFQRERNDGRRGIYIMNEDGSNQRELLVLPEGRIAADPEVSPDGSKIAFMQDDAEGSRSRSEIYVANIDGTDVQRLTNNSIADLDPTWTPDGRQIVYSSERVDGTSGLFIMDADGANRRELLAHPGGLIFEDPDVSRDGSKIVFVEYGISPDTKNEIYVANIDGTDIQRLTNNSHANQEPSWIPNREKIVFFSQRTNGTQGLFIMDANGTNQQELLVRNDGRIPANPEVSPDGSKIAFVEYGVGSFNENEIYVFNIYDNKVQQLTNNFVGDIQPSWVNK